jgi:High potential iron-sulfur protein
VIHSRRTFLIGAAGVAPALGASKLAFAQGNSLLSEEDPQAKTLGYKNDATAVDKAKFPKYAAGQICGDCQFYQGKPTDAAVPVRFFRKSSWRPRDGAVRG